MKNRAGMRRIGKAVSRFTVDYMHRHKHPVNAALHIVGVPAAFFGFWLLLKSIFAPAKTNILTGLIFVFFGYLFQYLGHRSQGNEVGEVILLKKIGRKLFGNLDSTTLQTKLWQALGGTKPVRSARHTPSNGNGHNGNGHNGNGHKQPLLNGLVWWKQH